MKSEGRRDPSLKLSESIKKILKILMKLEPAVNCVMLSDYSNEKI